MASGLGPDIMQIQILPPVPILAHTATGEKLQCMFRDVNFHALDINGKIIVDDYSIGAQVKNTLIMRVLIQFKQTM